VNSYARSIDEENFVIPVFVQGLNQQFSGYCDSGLSVSLIPLNLVHESQYNGGSKRSKMSISEKLELLQGGNLLGLSLWNDSNIQDKKPITIHFFT
jgi:hypothetical protein